MKIGLGHLRLSPDAFWRMTLVEFFTAVDGYLESKGVKGEGAELGPPTREEVEALFAMTNKEQQGEQNG